MPRHYEVVGFEPAPRARGRGRGGRGRGGRGGRGRRNQGGDAAAGLWDASSVAVAAAGHAGASSPAFNESVGGTPPSDEHIDAALTLPQLRTFESVILKAKSSLEESLEALMLKYKRVRAKMYRDHKHAVIAEDNSALQRFQAGCPKPKEVWQQSKAELDKQAHCLQQQANTVDDSDLGRLMRKHLFAAPEPLPPSKCTAFRQIDLDQLRPADRACLMSVGDARWTADGLVDANSTASAAASGGGGGAKPGGCGRRWLGTAEARCLLANKALLFFGNSVVRRQMYTVLDLVAGPRAHRQLTNFTDVLLPDFKDERATSNSWIWDQDNMTRAYHGAQLFTVDLATGEHRFSMPHKELCGLTDTYSVFNPGRMRQWHEPVRRRAHTRARALSRRSPSPALTCSGASSRDARSFPHFPLPPSVPVPAPPFVRPTPHRHHAPAPDRSALAAGVGWRLGAHRVGLEELQVGGA